MVAPNRSPALLEASARLAAELAGDLFEPDENGVYWHRSRKNPPTPGSPFRCDLDLYGVPVCSCPGYSHHGHCWYSDRLKEILMTTETEETGTALVPVEFSPPKTLLPSPRELMTIREIAGMAAAGAIALPKGVESPEQVAAIMLYGRALGIEPMISLQELYLVNGRVTPSARVMASLVAKAEPDTRLLTVKLTYEECVMRFVRPSRGIDTEYLVTWDDLKKANLAGGNNALYPKDRLAYHCIKRILRLNAPDLLLNMGVTGGAVLALDDDFEPEEDDRGDDDPEPEPSDATGPIPVSTPEEASAALQRLQEAKAERQAVASYDPDAGERDDDGLPFDPPVTAEKEEPPEAVAKAYRARAGADWNQIVQTFDKDTAAAVRLKALRRWPEMQEAPTTTQAVRACKDPVALAEFLAAALRESGVPSA